MICSAPKGARFYYDILMQNTGEPTTCGKWRERLEKEVCWSKVFNKINQIKDIKLRWFQIRIVHRILATNVILYNMKVSNSENCTFCQAEKDSIQHIFWKCPCIKRFWQTFQQTVNETIVNMNLSLTENIILFGCDDNFKSDTETVHLT